MWWWLGGLEFRAIGGSRTVPCIPTMSGMGPLSCVPSESSQPVPEPLAWILEMTLGREGGCATSLHEAHVAFLQCSEGFCRRPAVCREGNPQSIAKAGFSARLVVQGQDI